LFFVLGADESLQGAESTSTFKSGGLWGA
jgi:hypothetical protein